MTDDNINVPHSIYPPRDTGHLQSREKRIDWLRVRRDDLLSNIAVLLLGGEPPADQLQALRAELAGVKDELRALGVDP